MDSKQLFELMDKMKFSMELGSMYNDICELKRFLYILSVIKNRINKGDIAKSVNIKIEPLNQKYNTSFNCENDEEFVATLTNFINYIDNKGMQEIIRKIEEETAKKLFE